MKFSIHPVTPYQQNCSLIWCERSRRAALVDPGGDVDLLLAAVEKAGVTLEKILLTHGHLDHVGGAHELARRLGIPIIGPHPDDAFLFESLPVQAQMFGFPPATAFTPDQWLSDGDTVTLGELALRVIHTPGHTPGHVVLFEPKSRHAFVGDVLFKGSIGRTDFPRGNYEDLIDAIRNKLFPLGDDVAFIPGHGPMSTLGFERRNNPFVGDDA
jgi:glyoxylase-like metal-dependent hydrolase (beta-lactamase superfamily II)